jgi:glycyl-tRNA synthetase beta chain
MPRLLLEIGCEELPARACYEAAEQLPTLCERQLGVPPARLFIGPRRLAVVVDDVPERTPDEWVKGPPEQLRDQAAEGFARRHGVAVAELEVRDGFLGVTRPGRPIAEELPDRLDAIVRGLAFGKSMRWDDSGLRFPRPVRWRCAKLDGETVAGHDGHSFGHRFTHGRVDVPDAGSYEETLRGVDVEPDAAARRERIVDGLDALGDWQDPSGVLAEVVHLAEWPVVLADSFAERYLELPERVIVTAMQSHQRYFPLGGSRFAVVANGGEPEAVGAGHRRVLEARLEDAAFTLERDLRVGIEGLGERLGEITFFAGAGTYADKTQRLVRLVEPLGGSEASLEAARLAKADQAAELVREFPDLEGYIGGEYARIAGFPEAVCAAIEEQYLPDASGGPLPRTEAGKILAAADKLDTLSVAFELGHRPTGSRDPYGLRRAAIGLCRLALEGGLEIDVARLATPEVADFVEERLEGLLDVPVEFVRAARSAPGRDLRAIAALAETLHRERESERFDAAYRAYERSSRLAAKAEQEAAPRLDPSLLVEDAEKALAEQLSRASASVDGVEAALDSAAALAPYVDRFFDEVLVMAEDSQLRANRLRLLLDVRDTVGVLGDLLQIPR